MLVYAYQFVLPRPQADGFSVLYGMHAVLLVDAVEKVRGVVGFRRWQAMAR